VGTGVVHAVRERLTRPSITFVVFVAAVSVFGVALLVGWATAGTREDLRRVDRLPAPQPTPHLVLLGAATALPPAPPARAAARPPKPSTVPRLIVGSG
jgi:hypothetical protein